LIKPVFDFFVGSSMNDYSKIDLDDEGYYLLDGNFDGIFDYRYHVETGEVVEYEQPSNDMSIGIIFLVLIIVGSLISFRFYLSRKSEKKEEDR
jgi:hypothetical protein